MDEGVARDGKSLTHFCRLNFVDKTRQVSSGSPLSLIDGEMHVEFRALCRGRQRAS